MSRDHTFPFPVLVMSSQKKVVFFLFLKKQVKKENCDSIKMESKLQKKKKKKWQFNGKQSHFSPGL